MCKKKEKKHYKPTKLELEGAPRAFIYELQMLHFSIQLYELFKDPRSLLFNQYIPNVVLEAALLHARNLLDFFVGGQPKEGNLDKDSIRAGYFVGKNGWWRSSKLPYLKVRKKDINESLSHLTFSRIKNKDRYHWNLPKIKKEIDDAYAEFLQLLPQNERGKWQLSKIS